jgi:hypothetical protein
MKAHSTKLKSLVLRRIRAAGMNWSTFSNSANQIIVYGSYALSANTRTSDLDILCIGDGNRYKSSKLHIVWISEQRTCSKQWLGSELATHVATHGVWIKGSNNWAHLTKPSRAAIKRKKNNILSRLNAMQRHWDKLHPRFQTGQLTKLRQDLQRYQMMRRGQAPLPKTLLDAEWRQYKNPDGWAVLLVKSSPLTRLIRKFLLEKKISSP